MYKQILGKKRIKRVKKQKRKKKKANNAQKIKIKIN